MTTQREKYAFYTVLFVLLVALALMLIQSLTEQGGERVYHVTVLTDGTNDTYWKSFRKGVEQAARENNIDVRYVTRYNGDPATAQINALRGIWEEEMDGVVISPVDRDALALALMEAPQQLKLTITGTSVVMEHMASLVSADNRQMGARLADAVVESGATGCTVFLPNRPNSAVMERYEGFAARLLACGISNHKVATANASLRELVIGEALVALEPATTELLCDRPEAAGLVYGIGTSNRLLRALEDGQAAALVVQSDYVAGYMSLLLTLEMIKGQSKRDVVLDCYTVTKDNMFTEPLVLLLFPI